MTAEPVESASTPAPEDIAPPLTTDSSPIKFEDYISIDFDQDEYTFTLEEVSQGVRLNYYIVVSEDVLEVVPLHSGCYRWGGPSGLFPIGQIVGQGQSYRNTGSGLCPPADRTPRVIAQSDYPHFFDWNGRNWDGPTDYYTGAIWPLFPPGTYDFQIKFRGMCNQRPYEIEKTAKVTLTP
ncbi:MAG: hypothetical protein O7G85_10670 [Planctomycetota bacterium]|nr:hypothetical protein [Planctomycetota bacterium]